MTSYRLELLVFDDLMTDVVALLKRDGRRFDGIKASVQRKKIFSEDATIPIEEGDIFERRLPSGIVERFEVTDAGFHEAFAGLKAHYQTEIRKLTAVDAPRPAQIVYNLTGAHSRVNIQSHDYSSNVGDVVGHEVFGLLAAAIQQSIGDAASQEILLRRVEAMRRSSGSPDFLESYKDFMAVAANHMTVLAPFIPALARLLA